MCKHLFVIYLNLYKELFTVQPHQEAPDGLIQTLLGWNTCFQKSFFYVTAPKDSL